MRISMVASLSLFTASGFCAEKPLPNFVGENDFAAAPDTTNVRKLRFLTSTDFPPFNFINQQGQMAGFQIEIAREICRELNISSRCQIKALEFDDLVSAAQNNTGDVLLAGHAMSDEMLKKFNFSPSFMKFPARFVAPSAASKLSPSKIEGKVGVIENSPHAAYLKQYFPMLEQTSFETREELRKGILDEDIGAIFDDGMSTSFWLATEEGACCSFLDGAYYSEHHFGNGLMMATPKSRERIDQIIEYGLYQLSRNGKLQEIYLRYFPISFY